MANEHDSRGGRHDGAARRVSPPLSSRQRRVDPEQGFAVCLVNLPTVTAPRSLSFYGAVPPIGLAYLAAATRETRHSVAVVDATGEALDRHGRFATGVGEIVVTGLEIPAIVQRIGPKCDVVGISCMFLHQ